VKAAIKCRCPHPQIVLVKILPAFNPSKEVGQQVMTINTLLETLKLDSEAVLGQRHA
jgi:hypothetical protein